MNSCHVFFDSNHHPVIDFLQFKAIKSGRSLYEADFEKVADYIEYVFIRYRDAKYYYDSFMKDYYSSYNV